MLTIDKIYLESFKRFFLANIKTFEAEFTSPLQIFLGSNGSGKSSLMNRLIGDPSAKGEFGSDGVQITEITKDNHSYRLISEFREGIFLFEKDGVNINDSRKVTEQRDLMAKELNLTKGTCSIITGNVKFTDLSGPALMNMLMTYSNLDLEFALAKYEAARVKLRDQSGVLNHLHTKMTDVETRLRQSEEEQKNKDGEIELLQKAIVDLMPFVINETDDVSVTNQIEQINTKINNLVNTSLKDVVKNGISSYSNIPDIENRIENVLKSKIAYSKAVISTIKDEMTKVSSVTGKVDQVADSSGGLESIKKKVQVLKQKVEKANQIAFKIKPLENSESKVFNSLIEFRDALSNVSASLANNSYMSMSEYNSSKENVRYFFNTKATLLESITKQKDLISFLSNASSANANCPSCGTEVIAEGGCSHSELNKKKDKLKELESELENLNKEQEIMESLREKVTSFENGELLVRGRLGRFSKDISFWGITLEEIFNGVTHRQSDISDEISKHSEYLSCISHRDELGRLSSILDHLDADSYESAVRRSEELSAKYLKECKVLKELEKEMTSLNEIVQSFYGLDENNKAIEDLSKLKDTCTKSYFDIFISNKCKEEMTDISSRLSRLLDSKKRHEHLISMRESYREDILKAESDLNDYKQLVDVLSPKTGVIADQMKLFLDGFFSIVNSVLENIYEYDINVVYDTDKENLDYKFLLCIEGENRGPISGASKGQKETINLAFTLAIMELEGLRGFPLFFDEYGVSLDDSHRDNFIDYQKRLLESGQVSQIFMASHLMVMHSGLSNNQTLVLHKDNLSNLPEIYNQHVIIE